MAAELSGEAVVADRGGPTLLLRGQGIGPPEVHDPDDLAWTAAALAANVAADNAEAVDRAGRGEPGWTALWPLPGRAARG